MVLLKSTVHDILERCERYRDTLERVVSVCTASLYVTIILAVYDSVSTLCYLSKSKLCATRIDLLHGA